MPPCRTAVEMRAASMPDSRATIASASSDVSRCCTSKSAGTYSASITGVIGRTLRSLTLPLQVCDSVAAVAIAGRARSVSARSSGTRMELNICASQSGCRSILGNRFQGVLGQNQLSIVAEDAGREKGFARHESHRRSIARGLLQQFRADERLQAAAPDSDIGPVIDVEIENRKT